MLSDRRACNERGRYARTGSPDTAVEQLAAAEARGIKLRPRALITTMYARLVLSDLFIHGIGGAKYDELTDLIIRRFFGIEPPAYITATATFRLPIERPQVSLEDVRDSAQRIREARYRPEAFLRDPLVTAEPAIADTAGCSWPQRSASFLRSTTCAAARRRSSIGSIGSTARCTICCVRSERAACARSTASCWCSEAIAAPGLARVFVRPLPFRNSSARLLDLCKVSS